MANADRCGGRYCDAEACCEGGGRLRNESAGGGLHSGGGVNSGVCAVRRAARRRCIWDDERRSDMHRRRLQPAVATGSITGGQCEGEAAERLDASKGLLQGAAQRGHVDRVDGACHC